MAVTITIAWHVIPVPIDIIKPLVVIISVNALQDMRMMALMKNVKKLLAIILGKLNNYQFIIFSATCDGENYWDCVTCNSSAHRYHYSPSSYHYCKCNSGYEDDGSNEEC